MLPKKIWGAHNYTLSIWCTYCTFLQFLLGTLSSIPFYGLLTLDVVLGDLNQGQGHALVQKKFFQTFFLIQPLYIDRCPSYQQCLF
jgi:hypothetical protein